MFICVYMHRYVIAEGMGTEHLKKEVKNEGQGK